MQVTSRLSIASVIQLSHYAMHQAATDSEVSKKRRKKTNSRDESLPMNIDIEIPGIPTIETEASNDTCESEAAIDDKPHALHHSGKFDDEDHCRVAPWSREEDAEQPPTTPLRVAKNPEAPGLAPNDGNGVLNESFGRTIAPTAPTEAPLRDTGNETPIGDEAMTPKTKTFKSDNPLMPLAEMDDLMLPDLVPSIRLSKNFAIPEDEIAEEGKEGIQASDDNSAGEVSADDSFQDLAALAPIPLVARESFTTVASEYTYADDDSTLTGTLDNVCPICLSGYRRGDLIFSSRHCVHLFHKDCIIQWVEKCTDCPVCRTGLVTDSEMRTAATSLVGKTRMFRAVASMQRVGTSRTTPPNTPDGPPANSQSPFHGTMRRQASSYES